MRTMEVIETIRWLQVQYEDASKTIFGVLSIYAEKNMEARRAIHHMLDVLTRVEKEPNAVEVLASFGISFILNRDFLRMLHDFPTERETVDKIMDFEQGWTAMVRSAEAFSKLVEPEELL